MGGGGYDVMMELALFIAAQWLLGRVFKKFGAPSILAQMVAGLALGPEGADVVPYSKTQSDGNPSVLVLIGNIGVALMIFESGMHLHFDKVAAVGKKAFVVAVIGTLAPIVVGVGMGAALGIDVFPDALSIGIALAPTSVGISLTMLGEAKFLNSIPGQTIITAAFIDDIFSLVMLVILINVAAGDITAASIVVPLVTSFAFVGFGAWLAIRVMPQFKVLMNRIKESKTASLQPRDEVHITVMAIFVIFFGWIGSVIGSHLLGTFVAGMAFANVPRSGLVWQRQTKRIVSWMMRLFFSASIGFSVPVSVMLTPTAFWKGLVLAAIPCIGAKLLSGLPTGDSRWLVGWAMVARGEFAYLVAQTAKDAECKSCSKQDDGTYPFMLAQDSYSALIWALLWSTVLAPPSFKKVLSRFVTKRGKLDRSTSIGGNLASQSGQRFVMRLIGTHHTGILHEVMGVLHACELDVLEAHAETDDLVDVDKFVVVPRSRGDTDLDDEKLHEIAERVKEAVNDDESQVIFEPIDFEKDLDRNGVLQIRLIGDHHPDILHEIFDVLAEEHFDVLRAIVDEHSVMGEHHHKNQRPRTSSLRHGSAASAADAGAAASPRFSMNMRRPRGLSWSHSRRGEMQGSGRTSGEESGRDSDAPDGRSTPNDTEQKRRPRTDSMLKETETIYAKLAPDPSGRRVIIDSIMRAQLRERIVSLIQSHECHGEVMLRMVAESDAHETVHPITAIQPDDEVSIVQVNGEHHPDLIHEILDALAELKLDVLHADIQQPNDGKKQDKSIMYVRNVDDVDDDEVQPATNRERRRLVRDKLTAIVASHELKGHVSVRPLDKSRPNVISHRIAADEDGSFYDEPSPPKSAKGKREKRGSLNDLPIKIPISLTTLEGELEQVKEAEAKADEQA